MLSIVAMLLLSVFSVSAATLQLNDVALTQTGNPGDTVTFTVNVANTDPANPLDVSFTATDLTNGANTITAPVVTDLNGVPANDSLDHTFTLVLPKGKMHGVYTGTLTATDKNDPSNTASIPYSVTLNSVEDFTLSKTSVNFETPSDLDVEEDITVTNTGSVTLTTFTADYTGDVANLEDDDGDRLTFSYDLPTTPLEPGQTATFTIHVAVEDKMDVALYEGQVTLTANNVKTADVLVNTQVIPDLCKEGVVGDLDVTIENPDDGDEYKPGEEVKIEVTVDNNGDDDVKATVEALLYNMDQDDRLRKVVSSTERVRDGDDKTFKLSMFVPTSDFDDSDKFMLYVKAYDDGNEDEQCNYDKIELDLERQDVDVMLTNVEVTPETVSQGDTIHFVLEAENIGNDAQDEVYMQLLEPEIGLNERSPYFDLDSYDDSDNSYRWEFNHVVPEDAKPGEYYVEAKVVYDDGDEVASKLVKVVVEGEPVQQEEPETNKLTGAVVAINPEVETVNLKEGQTKFVVPLILQNDNDNSLELTLDVTEISAWAEVTGVEAPKKLNPGDKYHSYVYMKLKEGVHPGVHNFRVNARNGDALLASKLLGVNVPEQAGEEQGPVEETVVPNEPEQGAVAKVKDFFKSKSKLFWLVGDIVLIILAVIFIRMLFKK